MHILTVKTDRRPQLLDVTAQVQKATAAIAINECADQDVARDVRDALDRLIPSAWPNRHAEGNSDSHVKTVLTGTSLNIFVQDGNLVLGRWQGVFFCEYDGPREPKLLMKVVAERDSTISMISG